MFNPTASFVVHGADGSSAPAAFPFVGESGNLTGWNPNVPPPAPSHDAQVAVPTPGAVDKGLAIGGPADNPMLTRPTSPRAPSTSTTGCSSGSSRPATSRTTSCPRKDTGNRFDVAVLKNKVYVSFARQNGEDELDGPGLGRVDIFTPTAGWCAGWAPTTCSMPRGA